MFEPKLERKFEFITCTLQNFQLLKSLKKVKLKTLLCEIKFKAKQFAMFYIWFTWSRGQIGYSYFFKRFILLKEIYENWSIFLYRKTTQLAAPSADNLFKAKFLTESFIFSNILVNNSVQILHYGQIPEFRVGEYIPIFIGRFNKLIIYRIYCSHVKRSI